MIITEYNEQWDKEASFNDGVEKNKLETVKKMLSLNLSLEIIRAVSDLTEEEILQLAKN